jgi:hypothetical protein
MAGTSAERIGPPRFITVINSLKGRFPKRSGERTFPSDQLSLIIPVLPTVPEEIIITATRRDDFHPIPVLKEDGQPAIGANGLPVFTFPEAKPLDPSQRIVVLDISNVTKV